MKLFRDPRVLGLVLFTTVMWIYGQSGSFELLSLDDRSYVIENKMVTSGLAPEGLAKAFQPCLGLFIPLTWISFMGDVSLFGLNPGMMHFENAVWHAGCAILLFSWLRSMTQRTGASFVVALWFAIHPINVESVAWVTERKNVLCMFFVMLSLNAWAIYVRDRSRWWYVVAIVAYGVSLLAKPMSFPVPILLCLLDFWPAQRQLKEPLKCLALEKIPFVILMIVTVGLGVWAARHGDNTVSYDGLGIGARVSNYFVSQAAYIGQLFAPLGLAVPYQHPQALQPWPAILGATLLLAITLFAWHQRAKMPFMLVGWLWFLIALVPTCGLVQVGIQARADRFTYLAQIGILVAVVWSSLRVWTRFPQRTLVVLAAVLIWHSGLSLQQASLWQNDLTLFDHSTKVMPRNPFAWNLLAGARWDADDRQGALDAFRQSLEVCPGLAVTWERLAVNLYQMGRFAEAEKASMEALRLEPEKIMARRILDYVQKRKTKETESTRRSQEN